MELISREELINYLKKHYPQYAVIIGVLQTQVPTIESRQKGKWETVSREKGACEIFFANKKCSHCGYEYCFPFNYKYCPECGTDMRGEE